MRFVLINVIYPGIQKMYAYKMIKSKSVKLYNISFTALMFKTLIAISLLTSSVSISRAEDSYLTIVGSWQIEDVRTYSKLIRQSGKQGQVEYFLTPLSSEEGKNGLLYFTCINKEIILDLELQQRGVDLSSIEIKAFSIELLSVDYSFHFDLRAAIIENDMLKIPVNTTQLNVIAKNNQFNMLIKYKKMLRDTHFDLKRSQEAVSEFLLRCGSSI